MSANPYEPPHDENDLSPIGANATKSNPTILKSVVVTGAIFLLVTIVDILVEVLLFPYAVYDGRWFGLLLFVAMVMVVVVKTTRSFDCSRPVAAGILALTCFGYGYVSTNGAVVGNSIRDGVGYPDVACCWVMFMLPAIGLLAGKPSRTKNEETG
ncbi:hypothetical protein CA13_65620 [Planctomycetes bacterium CA13]|uniref:Uncharacterized protein n=1 Tax=Novipirellula herctigrandis TaxID=2527986 RepID=A0A5C5ZD49_9BACT|nr:hypothetical protein CA13_65620 [Planctomycetes bacterium CA13]